MRFLRTAWFTPTFPPTALSTCASSVVGTCARGSPRRNVAAANPAVAPSTTAPPATTDPRRGAQHATAHGAGARPAIGAERTQLGLDLRYRAQVLVALAVGSQDDG